MNKTQFIILIFCFSPMLIFAKKIQFSVGTGYGMYDLKDLKSFQEKVKPQYDLDIKSLEQFPPYYFYSGDASYWLSEKWSVGLCGGYYSTGARNHYEDYSGFIKQDFFINAWNIGAVGAYKLYSIKKINFIVDCRSGFKRSNLNIEEGIQVLDESHSEQMAIVSNGWWIQPDLELSYNVLPFCTVGLSLGYEYNLPSKNHIKKSKDRYLVLNGETLRISWSGFRSLVCLKVMI